MPGVQWLARFRSGTRRSWRPRTALLMKELQLHHVQFIMAGVLVLLHLGAITIRKFGTFELNSSLKAVLEAFWVLWLLIPLLIGCAAVAEERKMGTLEGQLCLPAKRHIQFALKFSVVTILSIVFGSAVPMLLEGSRILPLHDLHFAWFLVAISTGIASVAFYASTLARNTMQALAPAVLGIFLTTYLLTFAYLPEQLEFIRIPLWRGPLIYFIGVPVMAAVLVALAYSNYKQVFPGWKVWRKNLLILAAALALAITSTAAIYHRPWELLATMEPPHGAAQLAANQTRLRANGTDTMVFLPDGRVWFNGKFLDGTNWADVVIGAADIVGIQRDASLWVSEKTSPSPRTPGETIIMPDLTKLVRMGNENNWKSAHVWYDGQSLFC
jgi:hypothetical protein